MGILFFLFCGFILGTLVAYPFKLGWLGWRWHLGMGGVGLFLGWGVVALLKFPPLYRVAINHWPVYPVWGLLGTVVVGLVVLIVRTD